MKKIRVESIGGISRHSHLTGIAASPDLELVAVCDVQEEALDHTRDVDEIHTCIGMENAESFRFTPVPEKYRANQMQAFADMLLGKGDVLSATVEYGFLNVLQMDAIVASAEDGVWKEI